MVKGTDPTEELLTGRRSTYGQSWLMSGAILNAILEFGATTDKLIYSGYHWPWDAIMNKLARLLETPDHIDSWRDIEGYARLVREDLEAKHAKARRG